MKRTIAILALNFILIAAYFGQKSQSKAIELGEVDWLRNYELALAESDKSGKDVLILFQEVPGCSTCRNYGQNVLSHPLMVEAIEDLFVPLVIHNNKGGADKKVLEKYNEPTWNNPVVRIVNANGENLVDRVSGNYSSLGLITAMKKALKAGGKKVPLYLDLLAQEIQSNSKGVKEKTYSMYCFWSGEKHLGKVNGVVGTEAGFEGGKEVVKVTYDSDKITSSELTKHAAIDNCSPLISEGNFQHSAKDTKYQLQHSKYKYLPLMEIQKTKINSALGYGEDPKNYLSPTQLKWLEGMSGESKQRIELYKFELKKSWLIMEEIAG